MATATIKPGKPAVTEVRVIEPEQPEQVVLTLSRQQAETLAIVFRHIGGDPAETRRGDTERMAVALRDAGVRAPMLPDNKRPHLVVSTGPWFSDTMRDLHFIR